MTEALPLPHTYEVAVYECPVHICRDYLCPTLLCSQHFMLIYLLAFYLLQHIHSPVHYFIENPTTFFFNEARSWSKLQRALYTLCVRRPIGMPHNLWRGGGEKWRGV